MEISWSELKRIADEKVIDLQWISIGDNYLINLTDGTFSLNCLIAKVGDEATEFETTYKNNNAKIIKTQVIVDSQPAPAPFAQPLYRTKRDAIPNLISIEKNTTQNIDYTLASELYISGGGIIIENGEIGDYIVAYINDSNSTIPSEYRAALCEAWPIVAKYIIKGYVMVENPGSIVAGSLTTHTIDTYPLNAKITAGLVLRIEYHAVDSGLTRRVGVNYHLSKKL